MDIKAAARRCRPVEAVALFRRLNSDGLTILLIEHNLRVVRAFSKHVVVLHHGAMLARDTAEEVLSAPAVIEAYIGGRRGETGPDKNVDEEIERS